MTIANCIALSCDCNNVVGWHYFLNKATEKPLEEEQGKTFKKIIDQIKTDVKKGETELSTISTVLEDVKNNAGNTTDIPNVPLAASADLLESPKKEIIRHLQQLETELKNIKH